MEGNDTGDRPTIELFVKVGEVVHNRYIRVLIYCMDYAPRPSYCTVQFGGVSKLGCAKHRVDRFIGPESQFLLMSLQHLLWTVLSD